MKFDENKYRFMSAALKEAQKAFDKQEVPIGAVVVYKNQIIGKGYNQTENLSDPTAHAEMLALTAAANYLQNWRILDCELYVTVEPCLMCAGAIINSRIRTVYFGVLDPKFGACGSIYNPCSEGKLNHRVKIYSGLLTEECSSLMKEFFRIKRKTKIQ